MSQKLKILFAPVDAVGHVNACIGIAEILRDKGHRIVFALSDNWRGKLNVYGFEEEIIELSGNETIEDPAKYWAEILSKSGMFGSITPMLKFKNMNNNAFSQIINRVKDSEPKMKEIVNRVKPDVIVYDGLNWIPSLMNSGIPWVWSISANPLLIDYALEDDRLPPSALGIVRKK